MFNKLIVKNFKALKNVELKLAPLTILIGPNNAGKSSILQVLAFMKQSRGAMPKHSGPYVDLKGFQETVYKRDADLRINAGLGFTLNDAETRKLRDIITNTPLETNDITGLIYSLEAVSGTTPEYSYVEAQTISDARGSPLITVKYERTGPSSYRPYVRFPHVSEEFNVSNADGVLSWRMEREQAPDAPFSARLSNEARNIPLSRLGRIHYLAVNRGIFSWRDPITTDMPNEVLPNGTGTMNMLLYSAGNLEYKTAYEKSSTWIRSFGLERILATIKKGPQAALEAIDPWLNVSIDAVASGFGANQLIPVIVQSFFAEPDSLIMIEEPEIHLHPAHQVKLLDLFRDILSEGKQVLVTTHSEHILMALQASVARKEITPEESAVYYLHREKDEVRADKLEIRKDGSIQGGLPGFYEVDKEQLLRWAKATAERNTE